MCFRGFVLVGLSACIRADSSWMAVIVFSQETVFASGEILVFPPSESSVQCPVGGRKERNHNSAFDIQGFFYLGLWNLKEHGVGVTHGHTHCRDLRDRSKRAVESRAQRSVLRSAAGNSQCVVISQSAHITDLSGISVTSKGAWQCHVTSVLTQCHTWQGARDRNRAETMRDLWQYLRDTELSRDARVMMRKTEKNS